LDEYWRTKKDLSQKKPGSRQDSKSNSRAHSREMNRKKANKNTKISPRNTSNDSDGIANILINNKHSQSPSRSPKNNRSPKNLSNHLQDSLRTSKLLSNKPEWNHNTITDKRLSPMPLANTMKSVGNKKKLVAI
jgi:hypothetical protein